MENYELPKRLVALRDNRNITQDKLAKDLGVSELTIQNYETGKSIPRVVFLCKLADYFEVSTDQLVGREPLVIQKTFN